MTVPRFAFIPDTERLRILHALDVETALKLDVDGFLTGGPNDSGRFCSREEVCEAALHKARLMHHTRKYFSTRERLASVGWLEAKGWRLP